MKASLSANEVKWIAWIAPCFNDRVRNGRTQSAHIMRFRMHFNLDCSHLLIEGIIQQRKSGVCKNAQ